MVDGDDEERDDDLGDRILVRPYVLPDDPDEFVEQPAAIVSQPLTIDVDVPTAAYPTTGRAPAPPADANDRRMVLWLVGGGLSVVVAAAIVMIALWPRNDSGPQQAASGPPVMPVGAGTNAQPARDLASAGASVSPSASLSASASVSPSASRPSDAASAKRAAVGTRVTGRTGPVANGDGQCLDAGTPGVATGAMLARPCDGSAAQRFTVADDKTLRIGGLCAAAGSDTVRSTACTGGGAQQWQSGPGGSVVNVGTGQCLTNPRNGSKGGDRVRLSSCQDDGQHWSLP